MSSCYSAASLRILVSVVAALVCGASSTRADDRPHIVFIIGEEEYGSESTMPKFARELADRFDLNVSYILSEQSGITTPGQDAADIPEFAPFPNLEIINHADLIVLYIRFRIPPPHQFDMLKSYFDAGKPAVALRTTSHGFWKDKGWFPRFFGGHYKTHTGMEPGMFTAVPAEVSDHPILRGVPKSELLRGGPYLSQPLADTATPLLLAKGGDMPAEPIAFTNQYTQKSRIFYTSLGKPADFRRESFRTMLVNAVFWALGQEIPPGGKWHPQHESHGDRFAATPIASPPPLAAPSNATVLFDGTDLSLWSHWDPSVTPRAILIDRRADSTIGGPVYDKARWRIDDNAVVAAPGYGDIVTKQEFNNYRLHVDFLIPEEPDYLQGRVRGASGVYLGGRYEIEIVDSFGREADQRSCGSILGVRAPTTNAARPAGVWQSLDVEFQEQPGREATISAWLNGTRIHDRVVTAPTIWGFRPRPSGKPMFASTLAEANSLYRMDTGNFSIALWIKTGQTGLLAGKAPLAEKWGFGSKSLYSYGGTIVYFASYEAAQVAAGQSIDDGLWHHVALVCSGDTAQLFIDGELSGTNDGFADLPDNEQYVFRVGDGEQGFIEAYRDHLRELRFYGQSLTADQIRRLAEGEDPGVGAPALLWTPKSSGTAAAASVTGPIRLQSDTSRVRFANIWLQPLAAEQ